MKVSVCLLTYNHENFIEECLDSIVKQEVDFKYEIVVGEDCSTDNTRKIVLEYSKKYPDLIKPIIRDENVGVMQNFSETISACQGDYIAHVDGDDRMLPGKLQKQVNILDQRNDVVIVSHPMRNFESNTDKTIAIPLKYTQDEEYTLEDLIVKGFLFTHSSKMFRKSSLPKEGIDKKTANCTDYLLHLQNALHGKIYHLNQVLGEHRFHHASLSYTNQHLTNIDKAIEDQVYALSIISSEYAKIEDINRGLARIYLSGARAAIRANSKEMFLGYLEKSWRCYENQSAEQALYKKLKNNFFLLRSGYRAYKLRQKIK